ncbi:MAG: hypothetical protein M1816_007669 [Peltula sp. TS41687]|nr:MAG: hypothetical protein M1816_007669 [Peltula sp. TS41687]
MNLSNTTSTVSVASGGEMMGHIRLEPPERRQQQSDDSPRKRSVPNDQKPKRLSLKLPIQSADYPPITSSPSTSPTLLMSPTGPRLPSPTQSSSFMVALAAQERRVLELKEELQRAESDLAELKRQWAVREAQKKRDDIRQVRQLQPLSIPPRDVEGVPVEEISDRTYYQKEHERRKAMSIDARPSSHRKVIAGQRHTRALSLLSPDRLNQPAPFGARPEPKSTLGAHDHAGSPQKPGAACPSPLPTSHSSVPANISVEARERAEQLPGPPKEVLLRTGRQMAEDLKEGLWTFIDDLRQATIGEERGDGGRHARKRSVHPAAASVARGGGSVSQAQNPGQQFNSHLQKNMKGNNSRRRSTIQSRANDVLIEVGEVFWREDRVKENYELCEQNLSSKKEESLLSCIELDSLEDKEAWEAWGSPKADGVYKGPTNPARSSMPTNTQHQILSLWERAQDDQCVPLMK